MKRSYFKQKPFSEMKPMKRTPLRRVSPNKVKKKKTKVSMWREYGLERPSKPRYVGLKGIYWYVLSMYTRQRDFKEYGTCISCNRPVDSWRDFDAGHYAPAGNCGFAMLFLEININGECKGCNAFDSGHLIGYERNLTERYGEEKVGKLKQMYLDKHKTITKEWTKLEYDTKIRELQKKINE